MTDLDDAAVALARSTVERAAPEEMPIFPAASEAYLAGGGSGAGASGDRMLGFGIEAAVMLLTPIAIEVAKDVLGYLKEQVTELATAKGKEGVDALITRLGGEDGKAAKGGKKAADEDDAPKLTEEQLEQVRARALEKAKQLKLDDDRAALLADSLVGSLATA